MIVTGWNNGSPNNRTGSGYGVRLKRRDRDDHFGREWQLVAVQLDNGKTVDVSLTGSFWRRCTELRSGVIGKWMLDRGLAPWPKGRPPRFRLERTGVRRFRLSQI